PPLGHGRIHICGGSMPDYGLDRCDGHHEMVDFRREKKRPALASPARLTRDAKRKPRRAGALGSTEERLVLTRRFDTIPKHKSGKAGRVSPPTRLVNSRWEASATRGFFLARKPSFLCC